MKKLLFTFLLSYVTVSYSQICSNYYIPDSLIKTSKYSNISTLAGSCVSPDGPENLTAAAPPSYAWLLANGYCYAIGPQKVFTMCFTFSPAGSTATLNAGYSSTGCGGISFSGFNLYSCAPGCGLIGSGLTFSGLTPGACYTWCFSGNCIGPGPGFDHVCPYYMTTIVLPIELVYFKGNKINPKTNVIEWSTATQKNNDYFSIERSIDGINFEEVNKTKGEEDYNKLISYKFYDYHFQYTINYYRLKQVDLNKQYTYSNIIAIDNSYSKLQPVKILNILGQEVNTDFPGIKLLYYFDGTVIKSF